MNKPTKTTVFLGIFRIITQSSRKNLRINLFIPSGCLYRYCMKRRFLQSGNPYQNTVSGSSAMFVRSSGISDAFFDNAVLHMPPMAATMKSTSRGSGPITSTSVFCSSEASPDVDDNDVVSCWISWQKIFNPENRSRIRQEVKNNRRRIMFSSFLTCDLDGQSFFLRYTITFFLPLPE